MDKKTLVIGASEKLERYSNKAIRRLRSNDYTVKALGLKRGYVGDVEIENTPPKDQDFHTITIYLNPDKQQGLYDYITTLHPQRVIFNPGAENEDLSHRLSAKGIEVVNACTLVMLSTNQY